MAQIEPCWSCTAEGSLSKLPSTPLSWENTPGSPSLLVEQQNLAFGVSGVNWICFICSTTELSRRFWKYKPQPEPKNNWKASPAATQRERRASTAQPTPGRKHWPCIDLSLTLRRLLLTGFKPQLLSGFLLRTHPGHSVCWVGDGWTAQGQIPFLWGTNLLPRIPLCSLCLTACKLGLAGFEAFLGSATEQTLPFSFRKPQFLPS